MVCTSGYIGRRTAVHKGFGLRRRWTGAAFGIEAGLDAARRHANRRFLSPGAVRPTPWLEGGLLVCSAFYAFLDWFGLRERSSSPADWI